MMWKHVHAGQPQHAKVYVQVALPLNHNVYSLVESDVLLDLSILWYLETIRKMPRHQDAEVLQCNAWYYHVTTLMAQLLYKTTELPHSLEQLIL